jgi:hypothetical protein
MMADPSGEGDNQANPAGLAPLLAARGEPNIEG